MTNTELQSLKERTKDIKKIDVHRTAYCTYVATVTFKDGSTFQFEAETRDYMDLMIDYIWFI